MSLKRSSKMKKGSIVLIIILSFIFLVCSGCVSSHISASDEEGNNSSEEISKNEKILTDNSESGQASNPLSHENIISSEKVSPYLYWEYELGDIKPENLSEGRSNIQDCVAYSQNGKYLAVVGFRCPYCCLQFLISSILPHSCWSILVLKNP